MDESVNNPADTPSPDGGSAQADGSVCIESMKLNGLLSFGPDSPEFKLQPLNVLIGPNGSGKSNLIEVIGLLRSTPNKITAPMRGAGGGVQEWIWKGKGEGVAYIEAVLANPVGPHSLRHVIEFVEEDQQFRIHEEAISSTEDNPGVANESPGYRLSSQKLIDNSSQGPSSRGPRAKIYVSTRESILSQRKDPTRYPDFAVLSQHYNAIRLYREWPFGRSSPFRKPQPADMPGDALEEDCSNLGLFLHSLRAKPQAKRQIIERLRDLYEGLEDFDVRVKGGTVELFLTEHDFTIPAGRLSDGTLRYLCLLAILCDPDPPPLVCIEEPELGLHPDILPKIADLMIEASKRMQLIVTTHSDVLVDAMSEQPESVVVVEKHNGQTHLNRLNAEELSVWLDKYRLGELWTRGHIGGTRW